MVEIESVTHTAGDRHMKGVVQSVLRGEPGYTTDDPLIRLQCAALFAEVLDRA